MQVVSFGKKPEGFTAAQPVIFKTDYQTFKDNETLKEEVFGPSSLVVEANSREEIMEVAFNLSGHLTPLFSVQQKNLLNTPIC